MSTVSPSEIAYFHTTFLDAFGEPADQARTEIEIFSFEGGTRQVYYTGGMTKSPDQEGFYFVPFLVPLNYGGDKYLYARMRGWNDLNELSLAEQAFEVLNRGVTAIFQVFFVDENNEHNPLSVVPSRYLLSRTGQRKVLELFR